MTKGQTLKKAHLLASLGAAGALALGGLAMSAPAFADTNGNSSTSNGTMHCDLSSSQCQHMVGPIIPPGPLPPGVVIPGNCPAFLSTGNWMLAFVSGNAVMHFTQNANGDWGGLTATGQAQLTNLTTGTVEYAGQATEWGGGGQNSNPGGPPTQQSAGGFTSHFHGSGPAGSIDISASQHSTTNNAGTPTANKFNVNVTCS
jgi:hypothetical protein